jgi:hypothetical protein
MEAVISKKLKFQEHGYQSLLTEPVGSSGNACRLIRKVPSSNLGQNTGNPEALYDFFVFPGICRDNTSNETPTFNQLAAWS